MKLAIKTKNVKEYKQAVASLYAFGFVYYDSDEYKDWLGDNDIDNDYSEYPYILVNTSDSSIDFGDDVEDYPYSTNTFIWAEDYDKLVDKLKNSASFVMTLTNDYNAEVTEDGIVVGCQTIGFNKFDELSKIVQSFRNR